MKRVLTPKLYESLVREGYKYFLIQDVQCGSSGKMSACAVCPLKQMPCSFPFSCTGILDEMITSIIYGKAKDIEIYLEQPRIELIYGA